MDRRPQLSVQKVSEPFVVFIFFSEDNRTELELTKSYGAQHFFGFSSENHFAVHTASSRKFTTGASGFFLLAVTLVNHIVRQIQGSMVEDQRLEVECYVVMSHRVSAISFRWFMNDKSVSGSGDR